MERFFSSFKEKSKNIDFYTCHVRAYEEEPLWCWWPHFKFKNFDISNCMKLRSFNPIYRISNSALNYLDDAFKRGWWGHHEVIIPSLLKVGDFKISDFGGIGAYIDESHNKFYNDSDRNVHGILTKSSVRYRPCIQVQEISEKNCLYHPVKDTPDIC